MLEFELNSPIETATLVEFFARCGWQDEDAGAKLEWALAASEEWVLCRLDGELIGFGRSCRLGPIRRVVFDVMVDSRFRGQGLRSEIVRLLSENAGGLEEISVFSERDYFPLGSTPPSGDSGERTQGEEAAADIYLGKKYTIAGGLK